MSKPWLAQPSRFEQLWWYILLELTKMTRTLPPRRLGGKWRFRLGFPPKVIASWWPFWYLSRGTTSTNCVSNSFQSIQAVFKKKDTIAFASLWNSSLSPPSCWGTLKGRPPKKMPSSLLTKTHTHQKTKSGYINLGTEKGKCPKTVKARSDGSFLGLSTQG